MIFRNLLGRWSVLFRAPVRAAVSRPASPPALEPLEDRSLMAAPPTKTYVAVLYQSVTQRDGSAADIMHYTLLLRSGVSTVGVAANFLAGYEAHANFVDGEYVRLLDRHADAGTIDAWVRSLQAGTPRDQLTASLLGSDEFYARVGNAPDRFLQAIHRAIFHREIDNQAVRQWLPGLREGKSREGLATRLLALAESDSAKVVVAYQDILNREPTQGERCYWTAFLQQGNREVDLLAQLYGSTEFCSSVAAIAAWSPIRDPNWAARQFWSAYAVRPLPLVVSADSPLPSATSDGLAQWAPSNPASKA